MTQAKYKPQVILTGSIFIYAPDNIIFEIFMLNDLFRVKRNGEINNLIKFDKLDYAIRFTIQNIK